MIYMSPKEAKELLNTETEFKILDVRENYEHDQCNISCMHIPMAEIKNNIDGLKKIKKIAVMCRSGKRAEAVANWLEKEHYFQNLIVIEGGILNWKEQIDPSLEIE